MDDEESRNSSSDAYLVFFSQVSKTNQIFNCWLICISDVDFTHYTTFISFLN